MHVCMTCMYRCILICMSLLRGCLQLSPSISYAILIDVLKNRLILVPGFLREDSLQLRFQVEVHWFEGVYTSGTFITEASI